MLTLLLTFQLEQTTLLDHHKVKVLNAIKQVESRNCIDVKHKVMKRGLHKGQSAIGCFGLMPKTIKETLKGSGLDYNTMTSLVGENAFKSILDVDYIIASKLYDRLDRRYQGNTKKIVYSWLNGSVGKVDYKNHWYVKRVLKEIK